LLLTSQFTFLLEGTVETPCPFFCLRLSSYTGRYGVFHTGLSQKLRCFFRRRWVDVKPRAPFKACRFSQLGHELDVPVKELAGRILNRGRVNHKVVRRIVEYTVRFHKKRLQRLAKAFEHLRRRIFECRLMALGENPSLKRESRSIRSYSKKVLVLA